MNTQVHPAPGGAMPPGTLVAGGIRWWRRVHQWWADARRHAAERRAFDELDDAALRDLGMRRCEYESYRAEANALAPRTRRRVQRPAHPEQWL